MFEQLIEIWSKDLAWVWISAVPRQAALILGVALLVRCFPRMAAAWRHWMWLVAALAIGLIPWVATLLPPWPVIPAEWIYGPAVSQATQLEAESMLGEHMVSMAARESLHFGWLEVVFLIWLVGVVLLVARLGAGMLGLRSLQRGRLPVCRGRLCARLEYCRKLAKVETLVDLYLSKRSPLPMTWGVLRPAINLPREAENWSDERLDAVFLHELAHIHRADCWSNMALKLVCAFNWFNPFVWMAARRTYLAQEVACDDFACQRLRPSDYARHLLELTAVVKDFHRRKIEPAVGLSSCDHLRFRVAATLDPKRSRRALPSRTASLMSSLVFLAMGVMAMVSLRFVSESRVPASVTGVRPVVKMASIGEAKTLSVPGFEDPALAEIPSVAAIDAHPLGVDSIIPPEPTATIDQWVGPTIPENHAVTVTVPVEDPELGFPPMRDEEEANRLDVVVEEPVPDPRGVTSEIGEVRPMAPRPVTPPKVMVAKKVIVPPVVKLRANRFTESTIDWRDFQRRPGSRRGRSVVLTREESECNRYWRLSPSDRARAGSLGQYLRQRGIHLTEAELIELVARTSNRRRR